MGYKPVGFVDFLPNVIGREVGDGQATSLHGCTFVAVFVLRFLASAKIRA
jgi:hypothetical protein